MSETQNGARRPTARRRSVDRMERFLKELEERGSVRAAAKAAGLSPQTVYTHRAGNPEFAAAWDEAHGVVLGRIEETLFQRAVGGDTAVLIYLGKCRLKWSDRPSAEDQDLRQQLEDMKASIEELDGDAQVELLRKYGDRRKAALPPAEAS